jgi:hypothetical protein
MKITDEQCEAAMDFLRDNAAEAGQAKANRMYLDDYTKSLMAILMTERAMDSLGAQERYARAHPKYLTHLEGLKVAIAEDVRQQYLMEAAKVKIDVWRSLQARERAGLV